jgi:3-demethoxyubiquinol 3-hydroxylase
VAGTVIDQFLTALDDSLRTVFAPPRAVRPNPGLAEADGALSEAERRESAALMRINHVGEVCAQALYAAQALATRNAELKAQFSAASKEETDHLAWTRERVQALGDRVSWLNPVWYAGAFGLGYMAGKFGGDRINLGFLMETERQVEAHLQDHLNRLPLNDLASRAIVQHMQRDEAEHANAAQRAGAVELPAVAKKCMRVASRVMTTVAYRI